MYWVEVEVEVVVEVVVEVDVALVGRTGAPPDTVPVDDAEVLGTEEDVVEDVSVLTTVVVWVVLPSEAAVTVKVRVITVVTIRVGFMTPVLISLVCKRPDSNTHSRLQHRHN